MSQPPSREYMQRRIEQGLKNMVTRAGGAR